MGVAGGARGGMGVAGGASGGMGVACGARNTYATSMLLASARPCLAATGAALTVQQQAHDQLRPPTHP
eukprot:986978-Rhodomonas_salina.1